jgi:hypothetical protein
MCGSLRKKTSQTLSSGRQPEFPAFENREDRGSLSGLMSARTKMTARLYQLHGCKVS